MLGVASQLLSVPSAIRFDSPCTFVLTSFPSFNFRKMVNIPIELDANEKHILESELYGALRRFEEQGDPLAEGLVAEIRDRLDSLIRELILCLSSGNHCTYDLTADFLEEGEVLVCRDTGLIMTYVPQLLGTEKARKALRTYLGFPEL